MPSCMPLPGQQSANVFETHHRLSTSVTGNLAEQWPGCKNLILCMLEDPGSIFHEEESAKRSTTVEKFEWRLM